MQTWIYFALTANLIWAICSLIDKFVLSRGYIKNPFVYIVLNGLTNIFLMFMLPFVGFESLKFTDFLIALSSEILLAVSVILYYKAVIYEEISKVAILFQLGPIFALILSFIFLNEKLTANHILGFIFFLFAGIIVSLRFKNKLIISKAFPLIALSMILGSIGLVMVKYVYTVTTFWSAFLWLRAASFIALFVIFAPSVRKEFFETFKNMKNKTKGLMLTKMIIDFSAFIFAGFAIISAPVSLYSALTNAAFPLFVFALALLASIYFPSVIKEDINKKAIAVKIIAILFIIIGVVFVNL